MARIVLGVLCVILAVLQYQLWVGEGSFAQVHRLENKLESLRQDNAQQKSENKALAARIQELKSGNAAVERLARSELGLVGKNETFFLTVEGKQGESRRSDAGVTSQADNTPRTNH